MAVTDESDDAAALRVVDNAECAAQMILDGPYADLRESFVRNILVALRAAYEKGRQAGIKQAAHLEDK